MRFGKCRFCNLQLCLFMFQGQFFVSWWPHPVGSTLARRQTVEPILFHFFEELFACYRYDFNSNIWAAIPHITSSSQDIYSTQFSCWITFPFAAWPPPFRGHREFQPLGSYLQSLRVKGQSLPYLRGWRLDHQSFGCRFLVSFCIWKMLVRYLFGRKHVEGSRQHASPAMAVPGHWPHARLVLRKRCTVVGWRPLAERGFPRCLSGEVLPSCQAATFACLWRVHAHTRIATQKCLLHVTSRQSVKTYCGFLDAFRNSLHFGTLWAIFPFGIFGGSKMHAVIFFWYIVRRWLQQQPPLWVPRWIESKYCSTHLQHR